MLDGLRRASQGTIGKLVMTIVMGLIIVSFVIWGVGDMLRGFSSNTVAKVGSTTITSQQYQNELQSELYRVQRQLRQPLTPQQARALGLDAQVLDEMIVEATINERARALGLGISDQAIAELVRKEPSLRDSNGQFDRAKFDSILREQGLNERAFIARQRDLYLRQQIQYSLVDGLSAPKPLVDALQATRSETREIAYFTLGPAAAGDVPPPSDEALKAYYNEHKAVWRAPELRSFDALVVTPATLAKPDSVSDEDVRAQYDKDLASKYTVPEKRKLQQIVFPTEAEAQEASAKIKAGESFGEIAEARHLSDAELDIGEVTKTGAFDPAIADAAFALPQGGVSGPIKGQFGYVLARVVAITPGEVKPFDAVKDAIRREIAASRASDSVQTLHDRIEDAKASGKTVAEAARSVGLEAKSYAGVDRQGRNAEGGDAGVVDKSVLLPAVFASDVGVDDEALNTQDRGYIWFSVTRIDPARDLPFDDVKAKVADAWRAEETSKRLADAAAEDVKKLNSGADIAELAKAAGAELKTAKDIKRAGGGDLPQEVVNAVFGVGPDHAGTATAASGRVVFKVTADMFPEVAAGDPDAAAVPDRIKNETGNAIVEQYVDALKREIGVSIDRRVLQSAEGG
jgi:peptidyl-prolyl cis-trans isomerase D